MMMDKPVNRQDGQRVGLVYFILIFSFVCVSRAFQRRGPQIQIQKYPHILVTQSQGFCVGVAADMCRY